MIPWSCLGRGLWCIRAWDRIVAQILGSCCCSLWPSDFTFLPLWVLSPFSISLVSINITGPPCISHTAKVSIYYGHSKILWSPSCHDNCQCVLIVKYYVLRSDREENLLYVSSYASSTYFMISACYLICLRISFIIY